MNTLFISFEGEYDVIQKIHQLAKESSIESSQITSKKAATGPLDAPLSPEEIKTAIEFITCILKGGLVAYEFLTKVRKLLNDSKKVVLKIENKEEKKPIELSQNTNDEELKKITD